VHADISVHAKLLTGGVLPLCATLASESIFAAFQGDDKTDALLHGHSYTAHAVGCQVALESLRELKWMHERGEWNWARRDGGWISGSRKEKRESARESLEDGGKGLVWSVWNRDFVQLMTQIAALDGVWALGSVLAIYMKSSDGAGYTSNAAKELQAALSAGGRGADGWRWNVSSRVLGNVLYLMAGQKTGREDIARIEKLLLSIFGVEE